MKKSFLLAFGLLSMGAFAQNTFPSSGNVGIGTTNPQFQLEIDSAPVTSGSKAHTFIGSRSSNSYKGLLFYQTASSYTISFKDGNYSSSLGGNGYWTVGSTLGQITFNSPATQNTTEASISFINGTSERMRINKDGKVRIANGSTDLSTPDGYRLFVEDGILTEKVKVAVEGTANWADYVFADEYKLMPLKDVEEFTKENKHLPNVPSAEEMVTNGLNVAEMDAKLLEKIEELTLYLIEQNKQIELLKEEIKILKEQKQ